MTMAWVAVGTAVVAAGASYLGAKKQADAAGKAADINQNQFAVTNAQQQPFIQSGYGALSRLNTLLGIGGPNNALPITQVPMQAPSQLPAPGPQYQPTMPSRVQSNAVNPQLRQLLSIRADSGDAQAAQLLKAIV